jgi:hypothetical protein
VEFLSFKKSNNLLLSEVRDILVLKELISLKKRN